jgi:putative nucleotide binding protein
MTERPPQDRNSRPGQNYNRNGSGGRPQGQPYQRFNRNDRNDQGPGGYRKKTSGIKEFALPTGTIVYILDIMEHGSPSSQRGQATPIIQAIETPGFNLFEMSYNRSQEIRVQEKVVIDNMGSSKIGKVRRRLKYQGLTQTAKDLLLSTLELHVTDSEQLYLAFLNNAQSLTKKRHQLNLLPGVGEKLMWDILKERETKKFESFDDFDTRVKVKIKSLIAKRILNEIIDDEQKHYLFVKRRSEAPETQSSQEGYQDRPRGDGGSYGNRPRGDGGSYGSRPRSDGGYGDRSRRPSGGSSDGYQPKRF